MANTKSNEIAAKALAVDPTKLVSHPAPAPAPEGEATIDAIQAILDRGSR